jgi:hypothetical protein
MRFFQIHETGLFWGIVQGVPAAVLFVSAVWFWARERRARSVICALVGALASSFLVHAKKPMAVDYSESFGVAFLTIVTTSLLQVLLVVYLGTEAEWSNWKADLGLGSMAGIALAVAQGPVSQGASWIGRILQGAILAVAGILVLLGIRKLKEKTLTTALASALLLGAMMMILVEAMGYRFIPK